MITISVDLFIVLCAFAFLGFSCVVFGAVLMFMLLRSDKTGKSNIFVERESAEGTQKTK